MYDRIQGAFELKHRLTIVLVSLGAAAFLLSGCATPSAPVDAVQPASPPASAELVTFDAAKQIAQDDIRSLISLIPEGYIDGDAEIPQSADDMQPCEAGAKDEWRWVGATNFGLTALGQSDLSTESLRDTLSADGKWTLQTTDSVEQDDPIRLTANTTSLGVVFLKSADRTGRIAVFSPCFSLPGGPVTGTEY